MNPILYLHTLKYLRVGQVGMRLLYLLPRKMPKTKNFPIRRMTRGSWVRPPLKESGFSADGKFRALNSERNILAPSIWNDESLEKLWLYNLHYFEGLISIQAQSQPDFYAAMIERWVHENPPVRGVGWDPYPISLRTVNWIKWAFANESVSEGIQHSLTMQIRFLMTRLETHLMGNHLFANAKALIFAGAFFEGPEAKTWFDKGVQVLQDEISEQILEDGGHFERSPMYHSLILEDLLDIINLTCAYPELFEENFLRCCRETVKKMSWWLKVMCHPDGQIGLFNDAAFEIALHPDALSRYARQLGFDVTDEPKDGMTCLPQSGYIRLQNKHAVALLDVAPLGPDYLLGHAHADTLTFEFSLFGKRIITNTGTSCYGWNNQRLWERSTAAHNTCVVDGRNSSEVWGAFRVGRRAKPLELVCCESASGGKVECAHDGYATITRRTYHRRVWELSENQFKVSDRIEGPFNEVKARILFSNSESPAMRANAAKGQILSSPQKVTWEAEAESFVVEDAQYHPFFGVSVPAERLVLCNSAKREINFLLRW